LDFFANYKNHSHAHIKKGHTDNSTKYQFQGIGKALLFSSDELLPYGSTDLYELQYQFFMVSKENSEAESCS
jgi:hypothetical protein